MLLPKLLELLQLLEAPCQRPGSSLATGANAPITKSATDKPARKRATSRIVQTGLAAQFSTASLCRPFIRGRHRRAHHSIAARSPQPRDRRQSLRIATNKICATLSSFELLPRPGPTF